ncbi:MAG: DUF4126 family protein [Amaricoccus sp.]
MIVAALLIGVVAGLRTMTAPAVIAWAAWLGWIDLAGRWASFMASGWIILVFTVLAAVEFVTDQLPTTPSRTVPVQLSSRIVSGAFCGAVLGAIAGASLVGGIAGVVGALAGTYGGAAARARGAAALGADRPAALVEDAAAVVLALAAVALA